MEIQEIELTSLIPYEFNNKIHDETQVDRIANSIKEFGFIQPIVVDKNNIIVIGHGRYEASKKLGLKEAPCVRVESLSDEQVRKLRILDNKLNESERDIENLQYDLSTIPDFNIGDLEISVDDLFEDLFKIDDLENEEEVKDVEVKIPKEAKIVKRGDIFQLGKHRLMCGDSTSENDVNMLTGNVFADIMFTSPPYNAGKDISTKKDSKYENDSDDKNSEEYRNFLQTFTSLALNHSEYAFVNIQSLSNNKTALIDFLYDMKDSYADTIIRDKMNSQPAMGENVLNSEYEYIHVFSKKGNRAIGTIPFRGTLKNIIHIPRQSKNEFSDIHNATFSIEFAEHFIKNFAKDSVLDLFGGTGTSMIVSEQLGKKSYLMELEPLYCEVIIKRFHKLKPNDVIKCTNREIKIDELLDDDK